MTSEQVKKMRQDAGLSIAAAARCVSIAERSWQRYEDGSRRVPMAVVELFCIKNKLRYPPE